MKLLLQLIFRDAWHHRVRISLAVLATVAMSCMLVWLIGSIDLMIIRFDEDAENYLGRYHLALVPQSNQTFPESVIEELAKEPLVVQVTPARQIRNVMGKMKHAEDTDAALRRQRSLTGLPTLSPAVIGIDVKESPFVLQDGRWFELRQQTADGRQQQTQAGTKTNRAPCVSKGVDSRTYIRGSVHLCCLPSFEGVMGTAAAQSLQDWGGDDFEPVKVGDSVICRVGTQDYPVKIVGLVEQNLASGSRSVEPAVGALYVSLSAAQQMGKPVSDRIDFVYVQLREGTDTKRFAQTWSKHLAEQNIAMTFHDVETIQERLNQTRSRDSAAGLMGGAATLNSIIVFSTLVSVLIVFTALSMGVTERTRSFALLRTVGMPRWKIALLVFGESLILCLLGWLGGMLAGWCVLQLSVWMQPEIFGTGKTVALGMSAVVTSGIAALLGSLLSATLPMWRATRISPLEGMNRGYANAVNKRRFLLAALFGTLLLFVNPFIVYEERIFQAAELRQLMYTCVGLPTQIAGCLLLTPAVILLVEKYGAPLCARLFRLPKELLAAQLSSNLWRTLGTTLALCVGLGVYSFLEISGYSMLVPYIPSKTLPDTLVTFLPTGVPFTEIDAVRNTAGVDANRFLTLAVDQSKFSQRQSERFMKNGLIAMQTSAVVFGMDVDAAFGKRSGGKAMLEFPFQEGTLESALEKLRTGGRYCLVPDSFARRADVHVGDKLELVIENEPRRKPVNQIVEYEICGVVSIHGWLWMNKISGVRKRGYRSGAMLLAPYEIVKSDYQIDDASFFWFDRTQDSSGKPTVSDGELERTLQRLAERFAPPSEGISRPMVKVSSRQYLTGTVGSRSDEVIQAAAKMPLILLVISSFGMMGTMAAAIRSRRFEFGVLRSIGLTRFGLVRLVLAEAFLISLAVIVISVGFGTIAGWCFIGLMKYVAGFGGFTSPLTFPLYWLSVGFAAALFFCLLAAAGPAAAAGRTSPTQLLQEH